MHDGIDARAHARALGYRIAIDVVEFDLLFDDLGLDLLGQLVPDLVFGKRAVEQEDGPGGCKAQDVGLEEEFILMAGNEAGLLNQIGAVNRIGAEAQMRNRARARLLGVVDEVALCVEVGFLANDLDRVLVRAHGAVSTKSEEHGVGDGGVADEERRVDIKARVADIIDDTNRETVFGLVLG